jgi:hypothetical protein
MLRNAMTATTRTKTYPKSPIGPRDIAATNPRKSRLDPITRAGQRRRFNSPFFEKWKKAAEVNPRTTQTPKKIGNMSLFAIRSVIVFAG